MHPKIAIASFNSRFAEVVRQSLPAQEKVFTFYSVAEMAGLKDVVFLLHHDPPLHSGVEMLHQIKRLHPKSPIILVGENPLPNDIVEAFRLGANDFLFMPFQGDELLNCIHCHTKPPAPAPVKRWLDKIKNWLAPASPVQPDGVSFASTFSSSPAIAPVFFAPAERLDVELGQAPDLQVHLLGTFSVMVRGKSLPKLPGKKAKALLAYLLFRHPKPVHREQLLEQFWGDSTQESARNCLNVTLSSIRKCLAAIAPGREIIIFRDECYSLHPDVQVERDTDLFVGYWKKGRQIETREGMAAAVETYHQAFAFYRGDFLEDLPFEEWAERERERSKETWLVILDRLSNHFFEQQRYQVSMNLCRKMLEKDACLEDAHRRLMLCYQHLGMRDKAIRQFQKCRDFLSEELGVAPGRATVDLYERIREE
ncbi:MAG: BTAD domain-containing putative transcriptional regulator [Bacteroidota bacterium]